MKKFVALLLALCMVLGMTALASAEEKTGIAAGFGSDVKVTVTVEDGKIVEFGSHNELMKLNGKYAAMFKRQARNYLGSEVVKDE